MKKVIRWIMLVWAIIAIPFVLEEPDIVLVFFQLLWLGMIIGLMIDDLRKEDVK